MRTKTTKTATILTCLLTHQSICSAFVILSPFQKFKRFNHNTDHIVPFLQGPERTSSKFNRSTLYALSNSISSYDEDCDVLVLGSGPAARAVATLLSSPSPSQKLDILLADRNYDQPWVPNYGLWTDEWNAISDCFKRDFDHVLGSECIDREWSVTDCYFGGSFNIPTEQRLRVDRPYIRIAKEQLRAALSPTTDGGYGASYRVLRANHASKAMSINIFSPSSSLVHDGEGSTIQLYTETDGITTQSLSVHAKIIVDCTGHETKLVLPEGRSSTPPPGFQIAYGALVTVDESASPDLTHIGPYDKNAMALFDYRTDHFDSDPVALQKATEVPTFMYAMPLKENRIFFEETSLVARPAVSFQDCKDRCFRRLDHLGIKVIGVEEEEYCYIPMGGPLPAKDQRIIGFGGAAALVHPSTGFSLARVLMGACDVCGIIREGLLKEELNLDEIAASAYNAMWTPEDIAQRNFAVFGGEFLMKQKVDGLRGFFDGFFRVSLELWSGFLAGRPGLPNNNCHDSWFARMGFGLLFIIKLPPPVAAGMFLSIVKSCISGIDLMQSVTPLFGNPPGYNYVDQSGERGDLAAKNEAKNMIEKSEVEEEVPVTFQ